MRFYFYRPATSIVLVLIALTQTACIGWNSGDDACCSSQTPIYMDYETLRSSVRVVDPEPVESLNRLYLYDNYIFLVARNKGFHVLDNSDATNPVNVAFVEIPGNTEISIRDGYVFVDSYVDLVTLDARNPTQIVEISRNEGIFPWDAYQNIDSDTVYFSDLDPDLGVVVGYEEG